MDTLAAGLSRYFSPAALSVLRTIRVGIIGAGGLGSNVAMMLARSGIRHLTIADSDTVEASNLNRQAYFPGDIGQPKVQALARYLRLLEPAMQLVLHETTITPQNALPLYSACPLVVEAVDKAATKQMLYQIFAPEKELYVTASGMAGTGASRAMQTRHPRSNVVAVGDFVSGVDARHAPFSPRVMQAAALEADAVLDHILRCVLTSGENHATIPEY